MTATRTQGRYSPNAGLQLPAKPFRRKPGVPCPDVGDDARAWWTTWATSNYAWLFTGVEWQDLADTARLMDAFYQEGSARHMAEARQHTAALFGLATRARLHVTVADDTTAPAARTAVRTRADPRLKAV
jgi:hypothetical protein